MINNKLRESEPSLILGTNKHISCLSRILWGLSILLCAAILVYSLVIIQWLLEPSRTEPLCSNRCQVELVESIPEGLTFNSSIEHLRTHEVWSLLIQSAKESIEIGSMYWSLRGQDIYEDKSDWAGEEVYKELAKGDNTLLCMILCIFLHFSCVQLQSFCQNCSKQRERSQS